MNFISRPLHLLVVILAGWIDRHHQTVIDLCGLGDYTVAPETEAVEDIANVSARARGDASLLKGCFCLSFLVSGEAHYLRRRRRHLSRYDGGAGIASSGSSALSAMKVL